MQPLQHTKGRQMKHLKQLSETLTKTPEKHLKIIANICNIHMNSVRLHGRVDRLLGV